MRNWLLDARELRLRDLRWISRERTTDETGGGCLFSCWNRDCFSRYDSMSTSPLLHQNEYSMAIGAIEITQIAPHLIKIPLYSTEDYRTVCKPDVFCWFCGHAQEEGKFNKGEWKGRATHPHPPSTSSAGKVHVETVQRQASCCLGNSREEIKGAGKWESVDL